MTCRLIPSLAVRSLLCMRVQETTRLETTVNRSLISEKGSFVTMTYPLSIRQLYPHIAS